MAVAPIWQARHQGTPVTTIKQKLKTFAKRDLLDVLLLCLCFAVGWYAYDRSNICASSAKQDIQDVVETPKMVGVDVIRDDETNAIKPATDEAEQNSWPIRTTQMKNGKQVPPTHRSNFSLSINRLSLNKW